MKKLLAVIVLGLCYALVSCSSSRHYSNSCGSEDHSGPPIVDQVEMPPPPADRQ